MSDQPDDPIKIEWEGDTSDLVQQINQLIASVVNLSDEGDKASQSFILALSGIASAANETNADVDALRQQVDRLSASYQSGTPAEIQNILALDATFKALNDDIANSLVEVQALQQGIDNFGAEPQFNLAGGAYGQKGGAIGPAEAQVNDNSDNGGDGSDGGGSSSLGFGVAHGFSAAGGALKAPALRDVGALLYVDQAISKLGPLFDQLNTTIEKTPGLLAPLVAGFDALGVEEAGLAALVTTAAAGVAAFIVILKLFTDALNADAQATKDIIEQNDIYYKAVENGTTASIRAQLVVAEQHTTIIEQETRATQALIDTKRADALLKAGPQYAGDAAAARAGATDDTLGLGSQAILKVLTQDAGYKELETKLTGLQGEAHTASDMLQALTDALKNPLVAYHDLQAAQDAIAQKEVTASQQAISDQQKYQALIDTGTSKQVENQIAMNTSLIAYDGTQIAHLSTLRDAALALDVNSTAAKTYQTEINRLTAQYDNAITENGKLVTSILPLIKTREDEKAAVEALQKSFDTWLKTTEATARAVASDAQKMLDNTLKLSEEQKAAKDASALKDKQDLADFNTKQTDEKANYYSNQATQDADFAQQQSDKLADLYATSNDGLNKANATALKDETDYAAKSRQNALDLQVSLQDIREKADASILDAASHLDARKVADLQRNEAQQIDDKTDAYNRQKEKYDAAEAQKIADLLKSAQDQHDQRLAQGLQQIQDENEQYQRRRNLADQKFAKTLAKEQTNFDQTETKRHANELATATKQTQAYNDQQLALRTHMDSLLGIQTTKQGLIQDAWTGLWTNLSATASTYIPLIKASYDQAYPQAIPTSYSGAANTGSSGASSYSSTGTSDYGKGNLPGGLSTLLGSSYITGSTSGSESGGGGSLYRPTAFGSGGEPPLDRPVLVGDGGAELVTFHTPATIHSASDSAAMMNGGGSGSGKGGTTFNINGVNIVSVLSDADAATFKRLLLKALGK